MCITWEMPGTQSKITLMPALCAFSTKRLKPSGVPKRLVGEYKPIG